MPKVGGIDSMVLAPLNDLRLALGIRRAIEMDLHKTVAEAIEREKEAQALRKSNISLRTEAREYKDALTNCKNQEQDGWKTAAKWHRKAKKRPLIAAGSFILGAAAMYYGQRAVK